MYITASTPGFASPLKRGFIEPSPPVIKIPFVLLSSFWPHPAPVPDKPNTQPRTTATTTTAASAPPIARFLLVYYPPSGHILLLYLTNQTRSQEQQQQQQLQLLLLQLLGSFWYSCFPSW